MNGQGSTSDSALKQELVERKRGHEHQVVAGRQGAVTHSRVLADLAVVAVLSTVYFAAGKLGLMLAFVHASATAVWPPTGIALAAFLVLGYRAWIGIFLGAFLVNVTTAGSVATSLGIATGNTLEGLLGAYLVNRFANGRHAFDRPQDVFAFAGLAGMVSTVVSATFGVTSLSLGGYADWASYGAVWLTWWLGDAVGALIVAPLLVLWSVTLRVRSNDDQVRKAAFLFLLLFLVGFTAFGGWLPGLANYPLAFVCVSVIVWAAFQLGQRETATAVFVLSGIAIWGTLHGFGPFAREVQNESLLLLQVFMGVVAVTTMPLAAAVFWHKRADEEIRKLNEELERRVLERTAELAAANQELEAFTYSVSHDLRGPVRHIDGFCNILLEELGPRLDSKAQHYLRRIGESARHMALLIDDLLNLARVGRQSLQQRATGLNALVEEVLTNLKPEMQGRQIEWQIGQLSVADCDPGLMKQVFENLLSNAIKFTRPRDRAVIEIGTTHSSQPAVFVRDNGVGFNMKHADKLFGVFQRLHRPEDFEGVGVGLATVHQIVHKHGGRVWAEAEPDEGATFYFTLGA